MFDRKIELDSQQVDIIKSNISDCGNLQTYLTAFRKPNGAEMNDLQAQFGSLSDGKKDKLIESKTSRLRRGGCFAEAAMAPTSWNAQLNF